MMTLTEIRAREAKWDHFYLGMADYIASASKDPSTKVGAVIVRPDLTVASVGFNGFARNMWDNPRLYEDREEKLSRIVHAEMNAILNAHGPVAGYTLYCTFPPCDRCTVFIAQAGIRRVVTYPVPAERADSWAESLRRATVYMTEAGITFNVLDRL